MKATLELIAAPTGMQPGGYVREAYADKTEPATRSVDLEVTSRAGLWTVAVGWSCPEPVSEVRGDPGLFSDACALLVPSAEGAPWVTMGAPGLGVEGVLWRADGGTLQRVTAEGLGTVARRPAPHGWSVQATWKAGAWRVELALGRWQNLEDRQKLAIAVWQGRQAERGGLKSVTAGWVGVTA